ncbi:hypothetical protein [Bradyrhizobium sp. WSM3983]|uniref:hypothetical protein n=1 Tax=Bradyrhizobium sp. WSM3983 TaxID=1038867 RepID=UPI0004846069|nr:hypothetical protein [Bradyrhizobium sp. WSM3983]
MPLVIVPNAYPDLNAERVKALCNIRMMIYGNYAIRAVATAMMETSAGSLRMAAPKTCTRTSYLLRISSDFKRMDEVKAAENRLLR